jgi:hypothetical protein
MQAILDEPRRRYYHTYKTIRKKDLQPAKTQKAGRKEQGSTRRIGG